MMPEMDGLEATRIIRKNPRFRSTPVVALTAKAMKEDQERCFQAGLSDYVTKPVDPEKLLSLIHAWFTRVSK
jgi:CheY-like chemotaxis protein